MGYLLSSFLWMYVLCLIPVGLLVDRFGGKVVNAAGIGIWSRDGADRLSTGFVSMAATRIVMGMGESTSWPACNRVIREWFPASERGFANAVFGAGARQDRRSAPCWSPPSSRGLAGAPASSSPARSASSGSVRGWWFDKPERVGWLRAAERERILAERDGERRRPGQPASPPGTC